MLLNAGRGKREGLNRLFVVCLSISPVRVILVVEVSHANVANVKERVGASPEFAKPTNSDVRSDTAGWFTHPTLTTLNRGHCGDDLRVYGTMRQLFITLTSWYEYSLRQ